MAENEQAQNASVVNWQPIETAPKDGTRLLVYYPWTKTKTGKGGRGWKVEDPTILMTHWREAPSHEGGGYLTTDYPQGKKRAASATHWMPLPPAPTGGPSNG